MKWLYKYLADRQDVLKVAERDYLRWLTRAHAHPADRESIDELAGTISRLARSRAECDSIMLFITYWERQSPKQMDAEERAYQAVDAGYEKVQEPGWTPAADPPSASPPAEGGELGLLHRAILDQKKVDPTSDKLFRDGVRVTLEWVMRFRSDNVTNGEKDVQEAIAWAKSCNKME